MVKDRYVGASALITGAGSGIGLATAIQLEQEGSNLALFDRDERSLEQAKTEIEKSGVSVSTFVVDVADSEAFNAGIQSAIKTLGSIDVLISNVGVAGRIQPIESLSVADWNNVLNITLTSVFIATKAVLPHMVVKGGGAIVNTASVSGVAADEGLSAYNAAKAGVINFTRTTALENSKHNIRANCVCPGAIATPPVVQMFEGSGSPGFAKRKAAMEAAHPIGRMGRPEEVAQVICFLASREASFVSGAAYCVDGGLLSATGMPPLPVGVYTPSD